LISQTTFAGGDHAGKIRSDVLGGQMGVEIDGRADRCVTERLDVWNTQPAMWFGDRCEAPFAPFRT